MINYGVAVKFFLACTVVLATAVVGRAIIATGAVVYVVEDEIVVTDDPPMCYCEHVYPESGV